MTEEFDNQSDEHSERKHAVGAGSEIEGSEAFKKSADPGGKKGGVGTLPKEAALKNHVLAIVIGGTIVTAIGGVAFAFFEDIFHARRWVRCTYESFSAAPVTEVRIPLKLNDASFADTKTVADSLEAQLEIANVPGIAIVPSCAASANPEGELDRTDTIVALSGTLQGHRSIKGGVRSKFDSGPTKQKIFRADNGWADYKEEAVSGFDRWLAKVADDFTEGLLRDADLNSAPQNRTDRLTQKLEVLASSSLSNSKCLLPFNRGMDALMRRRPDEAEGFLAEAAKACPEKRAAVAEFALGLIFAQAAKKQDSAAGRNDKNRRALKLLQGAAGGTTEVDNPRLFVSVRLSIVTIAAGMPLDQLDAEAWQMTAALAGKAAQVVGLSDDLFLSDNLFKRFSSLEKTLAKNAVTVRRWEQQQLDEQNLQRASENANRAFEAMELRQAVIDEIQTEERNNSEAVVSDLQARLAALALKLDQQKKSAGKLYADRKRPLATRIVNREAPVQCKIRSFGRKKFRVCIQRLQ